MDHIIESQQFDQKYIKKIFSIADSLQKKRGAPLKGKILASLFYEPSTRTRFSFESAMLRLGGNIITTENAREFSSVAKGETLEDSIRVISAYADAIILRHYEEGASKRASAVSRVPIINAGDGIGQHPTQALLDLYTIKKEVGKLHGVSVAFVGDLKHGRTIKSLAYLLGKYKDVSIYFVSPKALRVPQEIKEYLKRKNVFLKELENLDTVISTVDVLYQTRIQKERFATDKEYKKYKGRYQVDLKLISQMKDSGIVMHPLPRVDEILPEADCSPKAVYFKQAEYGLYVRMAILKHLLS